MLNWKVAIENALVNGLAASKYEGGHMISVANLLTFDYWPKNRSNVSHEYWTLSNNFFVILKCSVIYRLE